ncbi:MULTISPECIES: carbohydrate ABC transporter permease [Streptomyces]|uniref:Putative binding-protein-dependent transport system integral membrane subunit n=1 Tax=Streptomyces scabiei (strain 87.22) TaxID=680198 RepID=C9Z2T1_STRSW|nr:MULTISPECIES: sugar ABC transporter permease [Streptomyces]MBP5863517.1 sugar ABC transporter permease [Streptomyces sp. LBUM 1484]MBP5867504.1 sugar ABC transporter permease [Streptomyces sp. LBUM 1485]MBP5906116.1 sugar ABC transporter permease [Streptomyces sp. LBUM 1478]MBP5931319.1 sugar ABC transporter permease [Streptomyces sp. LBUM 1479]KFG03367.1 ABC transporter permease [Streptomyces scabiei]
MTTTPTESPEAATPPPGSGPAAKTAQNGKSAKVPQGHRRLLTRRDRLTLGLMAGLPTFLHVALVWVTALASILLAFTTWDGIGFDSIKWVGLHNFQELFTNNPQFWPAVEHNVIWFVALILIPTPLGLFLAVQLDKNIRFSRVYQTAFFLPVVMSLAVIGFVWQLIYNPDTGLINSLIGANEPGHYIDWIGDPDLNLWAILIAASWRHTGYMMILYLAGLKGVDPSLREASALDGANEWQTFKNVIFPTLRPTNTVVLVVTIIEALRAFDLVFVFNKGAEGTELLSILVTNNIIGESSRIGYGSAIAVVLLVISLAVIIPYLIATFRKERRA